MTSTSVPVLACANSESRPRVRVALKTKLPDMKATPSAMASAVRTRRSRCASMLRNRAPTKSVRNMTLTPRGFFIASSTDSGVGLARPPAIRPSARNTTWSA